MSLVTRLVLIDDPYGILRLKNADLDLHNHLIDDADWDADYWVFDVKYLQSYQRNWKLYLRNRLMASSSKHCGWVTNRTKLLICRLVSS